jgi:malonate-semialdehyde dehydrogenase (acetylating)/methylmalonate-semialdehyde dehydrogenase
VIVTVGNAHGAVRERLVAAAKGIRVGNGLEDGITMGPVIRPSARDRILGYIEKGVAEGAELLLDGRGHSVVGHENGFFLGPSMFDRVDPMSTIGREEIFGPVLSMLNVPDLDAAIKLSHSHPQANAISIFTTNGKAARDFSYHAPATMVGVNIGVAAPMSFFPFGGAKDSFFGDLKAHGRDGVQFYTDQKVVIERWF